LIKMKIVYGMCVCFMCQSTTCWVCVRGADA
jgi:hypothetical protein